MCRGSVGWCYCEDKAGIPPTTSTWINVTFNQPAHVHGHTCTHGQNTIYIVTQYHEREGVNMADNVLLQWILLYGRLSS